MTQGHYCLDANIFITSWQQSYPPMIFLSLWQELSDKKENFMLITPIFKEIEPVSSEDNRKLTEQQKIAYARQYKKTVVTFEEKQPGKPDSKSNYKIPLICQEERVHCIDFIQMIQNMGITV